MRRAAPGVYAPAVLRSTPTTYFGCVASEAEEKLSAAPVSKVDIRRMKESTKKP